MPLGSRGPPPGGLKAARVFREIGANLVRQGSFAIFRREDQVDVDFGESAELSSGSSRDLQAARRWCPLPQGIGLRPQPWAMLSRPVGPATGFVRRSKLGSGESGSKQRKPKSPRLAAAYRYSYPAAVNSLTELVYDPPRRQWT